MEPNWVAQSFVGPTSVEVASVGPASTRRTSARRTEAWWSSPESGNRHLKRSHQKGDESRFVKRAGARRERWKRSSDARPKSRWLPLCKQVIGGKRLLPQPVSRSVVRPPIGCCARSGAVGKLLSRMEDT